MNISDQKGLIMILYKLEMLRKTLEDFKNELKNHIQEMYSSELNKMCIKSCEKSILCLENKIKELILREEK